MHRRAFLKALPATVLAARAAAPGVRVDPEGWITVGGRREFVLGLYSPPRAADPWNEVQEAGFNLINVRANPEDLARARQHGLLAWTALGSISPQRRAESEARIRKIVLALKDDPALLFWESEDEPSYLWKKAGPRVPPENIIATRRFVRSIDPAHPFYLNHAPTNLVSTLRRYNEGAEIVATDIYPVVPHGIRELYALWPDGRQGDFLNPYISQVGQYADKMRQVAGPSRALLMVLQAFAWEDLRKKDKDPAMVLYPTLAQTRFMAYQAIVHGANGLIWWGANYAPPESPVWSAVRTTALELKRLKSELTAPRAPLRLELTYHDTGHSLDRGIEWTARRSGKGALLIAVNADPNPVEVTMGGLAAYRSAGVLFESHEAKFAGGSLRDSFPPFGARVYRLG